MPDPSTERDALIAATAMVHGMTVVTGNLVDSRTQARESAIVPGLVPLDLEELLREPDDLAKDEQSERLARRLAPAFARRWAVP